VLDKWATRSKAAPSARNLRIRVLSYPVALHAASLDAPA
jgi:hypothetical protein